MEEEYTKILVGLDGSDEAKKAFDKAINVAKRNKASLVIANIIDSRAFQGVTGYDGVIADDTLKSVQNNMEEYKDMAEKAGCSDVKVRIEFGSPKVLLSEVIPEEEKVDLIMVGATGLTTLERLLIGSTSEYIIREAPCDVLIVR